MSDELSTQDPTPETTAPDAGPSPLLGTETTEAPAPETASAPEGGQIEEVEPSSFEELLEHLDLDTEAIYKLPTVFKVNGKEERKTLAELRESAQLGMATKAELETAKQQAKSMLDEANQQREVFAALVATFGNLLESVEAEINKDTKAIDWHKLRSEDPAEYSAKREEIRERRERLETMKREAIEQNKKALEAQQEYAQKLLKERLPEERAKFLERVPEWADDEKAAAERGKLLQYLTAEGFNEQDIQAAAYNGAVLALAVKAMRYDESKGKAATIKKKVVRIPKKVLKPGPAPEAKPNGAAKQDPVSILYG